MKPWQMVLFMTLVGTTAGLIWQLLPAREPEYQGKGLSEWLEEYSGSIVGGAFVPNQNADLREEAAKAIRQIGTNALPFLLKMAATQRAPPAKQFVLSHYPASNKLAARVLSLPVVFRWAGKSRFGPMNAFVGFKILGRQASPAIPALIQELRTSNNRDAQFYAMKSLGSIGPTEEAVHALVGNLRAPDSRLRQLTVDTMAYYLAKDLNTGRCRPECAQLIVPALDELLADPKADALRVIALLSAMGPAAKAAITSVEPFTSNESPEVRAAAINAVEQIAPSGLMKKDLLER
jgi:HEAT repeat protein